MPPSTQAETSVLLRSLDVQRGHVVGIINELEEVDLRRCLVPSGWTPLGLVQHLTMDVERFWFLAVVAGDQRTIDELYGGDDSWLVSASVSGEEVFERYLAAAQRRIRSSAPFLSTRNQGGGPLSSSAIGDSSPFEKSYSTSLLRPHVTPAISMSCANYSTANSGSFRTSSGREAAHREGRLRITRKRPKVGGIWQRLIGDGLVAEETGRGGTRPRT